MYNSGVYKISNTENGYCYIGSSVNLKKRWINHKNYLKWNKHHSQHLQNAWNKAGESVFIFTVLLYCSKEDCIYYEQKAIDSYNPEYNICKVAGSRLGHKCSEETKQKLRLHFLGKPRSEETILKMKAALTGRTLSEQAKINIGIASSKRKHTEESKAKISLGNTGKVRSEEAKNHMKVIQNSTEYKEKISKANSGRQISDETRLKLSLSHKKKEK